MVGAAEKPLPPVAPAAVDAPVFVTEGFVLGGVDMLIVILGCVQLKLSNRQQC